MISIAVPVPGKKLLPYLWNETVITRSVVKKAYTMCRRVRNSGMQSMHLYIIIIAFTIGCLPCNTTPHLFHAVAVVYVNVYVQDPRMMPLCLSQYKGY